MLLVQLGISTRDVWKFCQWQNLQTSLVLLIPNCTRQRMITYTNFILKSFYNTEACRYLEVNFP